MNCICTGGVCDDGCAVCRLSSSCPQWSGTARDALRLAYKALMDGPTSCRYHGTDFARSGTWMGEPRCDSCKQPARVTSALTAVRKAIEGYGVTP